MKKLFHWFNLLEEGTLCFVLLGLACMAFVQVVSRYVFHYSFSWFEELGRYLGIFMAFLGASIGVKYGAHFTMDALVRQLPIRAAGLVRSAVNVLSGIFFLAVVWFALLQASKLRRYGVTSAALRIPMYLVYLPIPAFSFSMAVRFFLRARTEWGVFLRGNPGGGTGS